MSIGSIGNGHGPRVGRTRKEPTGELLTVAGAAEMLGLSASCLNKWRITGQGPAWHRCGRAVRYARSDLAEWLAANRRRSTSEGGPRAA